MLVDLLPLLPSIVGEHPRTREGEHLGKPAHTAAQPPARSCCGRHPARVEEVRWCGVRLLILLQKVLMLLHPYEGAQTLA